MKRIGIDYSNNKVSIVSFTVDQLVIANSVMHTEGFTANQKQIIKDKQTLSKVYETAPENLLWVGERSVPLVICLRDMGYITDLPAESRQYIPELIEEMKEHRNELFLIKRLERMDMYPIIAVLASIPVRVLQHALRTNKIKKLL